MERKMDLNLSTGVLRGRLKLILSFRINRAGLFLWKENPPIMYVQRAGRN